MQDTCQDTLAWLYTMGNTSKLHSLIHLENLHLIQLHGVAHVVL